MNEKQLLLRLGSIKAYADGTIEAGGMHFDAAYVRTTLDDRTSTRSHVAPIGVFFAIAFIWVFLLSLFFLLIRETRTSGVIFVTIEDRVDGRIWTESLIVGAGFQRTDILKRYAHLQKIINWRISALDYPETSNVNS